MFMHFNLIYPISVLYTTVLVAFCGGLCVGASRWLAWCYKVV